MFYVFLKMKNRKIVRKYFLDKIKDLYNCFFLKNKLFLLVEFSMLVFINICRVIEIKLIVKNIRMCYVFGIWKILINFLEFLLVDVSG